MTAQQTLDRRPGCRDAQGRWPDADAAGVPAKTSAAAGLSLGIFMLALESERLAALVRVEGYGGTPGSTMAVSLAAFVLCVALLCRRPLRRTAPLAWPALAALTCSASLALMYLNDGATWGGAATLRSLGDALHSLTVPILLFLWVQRAAPFGRTFILRSFGLGAVTLGYLGLLTVALTRPAAIALVVVLPTVGAALLALVNSRKGRLCEDGHAGAATSCERWFALRAIAQAAPRADLRASSRPADRRGAGLRGAGRAFVKLVPFLCYAVIFGNVHFSWVGLQDGASVSTWVQLGASTGSALCGLAALGLANLHVGRAFEGILHLLLAAFALVALWLSTFLTSGYVFVYLVLLNVAQKLAFMLILLFGLPFARDEYEFASLWSLAYLSFFAGTCVSYTTSSLWAADTLNVVAACALAVVFGADIAGIVMLYGGQPAERRDRPAAGAGAGKPGTAGTAEGALEAGGTDVGRTGMAAAAATEGGFESEPYTCHLIANDYSLTRREEEILQLLVRGRDAAHVAEALCITTATARTHLRNIYAKLDVHSQQGVLDLFESYGRRE